VRYYDITISPTPGGPPATLQTLTGTSTARWTSHPGGVFDPGALDAEFDLLVTALGAPGGVAGASSVRIWGVDLATLKTAVQFSNPASPMSITVKGGMMAGLPLNNPAQAGLLLTGLCWQSFGNWRGTEMTLDLVLNAGGASFDRPANIILNWQRGQTLQSALQTCLATAFPNTVIRFAISQNLVAMSTQIHKAHSLIGLAQFINSITKQMQGGGAPGVMISPRGDAIVIFDGMTAPEVTHQLAFSDLIGQPTWLRTYELCIQTVMRADILVGDLVKLPQPGASLWPFVLEPTGSKPALRNDSVIQGEFIVTAARHVGRFRAADGTQWSTTFICIPQVVQ
jgi:hypothetical protein